MWNDNNLCFTTTESIGSTQYIIGHLDETFRTSVRNHCIKFAGVGESSVAANYLWQNAILIEYHGVMDEISPQPSVSTIHSLIISEFVEELKAACGGQYEFTRHKPICILIIK